MVGTSGSLWRNCEFTRLWFAQAVSKAGDQITVVALPLTAVLVLDATPAQMGLLVIADRLPKLLFSLFAGVWVDRSRRQPILVWTDFGRAVLLGTIPVAALLGYLTFAQLWIVAFAVGTLSIFFVTASISILPSLVRSEQLIEANSKLAVSDSVLTIAGPSAAGGLVQLVGAPKAIIADAVSYVLSALSLRGVGTSETTLGRVRERGGMWSEIGEGVRELVRTPVLRALAVSVSAGTFGAAIQQTVFMLFLVRELGLTPAVIGIAFACVGGGSLVGAVLAERTARLIGTGPAIVLGNLLWAVSALVIPLAGLAGSNLLFIIMGQVIAGIAGAIWGVNQMSLRQTLTPVGLFGRATAARQFLMFGMQMAGAALGGLLGGAIGLRATLFAGAAGIVAALLLNLFSPVRHVRDLSGASHTTSGPREN